jgi:cell wall-associated NlpC family hydrolase
MANASDIYTVTRSVADLMSDPGNGLHIIGRRDSQILYGEEFQVKEQRGGYIYGVSLSDGYAGAVHKSALAPKKLHATHIVQIPLSHIYSEPDLKTRPILPLSFMSRVTVQARSQQNGFIKIDEDKWVFEEHLAPIENKAADIAETALGFLHAPYLYGGRSAMGLDCSALVQLAVQRAGISCKRDSDQQVDIGTPVAQKDITRGDIVFFKGHTGIMVDKKQILNATARHMKTVIEDLSHVTECYGGITAIRSL